MQPKDDILNVYGAFAREVGSWVAIADMIQLLGYIGLDAQSVRSGAYRMKRNRLLVAVDKNGVPGYSLTPMTEEVLTDGDERIFRSETPDSDPSWVIALFTVPETERDKRYSIRKCLVQLGFGQGPAGSWFVPASVLPEAVRTLRRSGLDSFVTLWRGDYEGFGDVVELVSSAWDLTAARSHYQQYISDLWPVAKKWQIEDFDDKSAFVDYMSNLAAWRHLPYLDPGLSPKFIVGDWPGQDGRKLFTDIERRLRPKAMQFFLSVVTPSSPQGPD